MENPVIIFGAGSQGKTCLEIFNDANVVTFCFLDDDETLHGTEINDVSILSHTKDDGYLKLIGKKCEAIIAIEDKEQRIALTEMLKTRRKTMPVNAIHKSAILATNMAIGHGNIINAGTIMNHGVEIFNHVIINSRAIVEHEAKVSDFVQIGTRAIIGSGAKLGESVLVGAGAIISSNITIGAGAQIAPGSLVMTNVDKGDIMMGIPAKKVN